MFLRSVLTNQRKICRFFATEAKQDLVLSTISNGVARLTLNAPKKRNALSLAMLGALKQELKKCSDDNSVRAIILSAQPPVFSAGHDLNELRTQKGLTYHAKVFSVCTEVMTMVQDIQIPVIAAVKGTAAAAGCQLVASCDIVVAAENAKFSTPGIAVGLFCATPGVAVARNVPSKVAADMLLTGEPIDAETALRAGLVSRVVPEEKVDDEVEKIANRICSLSRPVVALGKTFFYAQIGLDRNSAYRYAQKVMLENLKLEDCQEGLTSFVEKRHPKWKNTDRKVS